MYMSGIHVGLISYEIFDFETVVVSKQINYFVGQLEMEKCLSICPSRPILMCSLKDLALLIGLL